LLNIVVGGDEGTLIEETSEEPTEND